MIRKRHHIYATGKMDTHLRTCATVLGPYHWPIDFPSPTPIWATGSECRGGDGSEKMTSFCYISHMQQRLTIEQQQMSQKSWLTNLMYRVVAVFLVDKSIEDADILLSLTLAPMPPPVCKGQIYHLLSMSHRASQSPVYHQRNKPSCLTQMPSVINGNNYVPLFFHSLQPQALNI